MLNMLGYFILICSLMAQLQLAECVADLITRIGDNTTLVRAVSIDRLYATFATHPSIASNTYTFNQYDFSLSKFYNLQTNITCQTQYIQQIKNYNNLTINKFIVSHPVNSYLFTTNFTTLNVSWVPTGNVSQNLVFGGSGNFIYQASQNTTCVNLTQRITTSRQITRNFQYPSEVYVDLGFFTSRVILLTAPTSNTSQLMLRIYDNTNMTLNWTIALWVANNTANIRMSVSSSYIGISDGNNLRILSCAANFTLLWNTTLNQPISDVQVVGSMYVIVATNASILQYNISNQFLQSTAPSPMLSPELNSGLFNGSFWLVVWKVDYGYLDVFSLTNSYSCLGCQNCMCLAGYCFNAAFDRCQWVGIGVACINSFNISSCVQPISPISPLPSSIPDPTSICLSTDINGDCTIYCSTACKQCYVYSGRCQSCPNFYQMTNGTCKMTKSNMVLFAMASIFNVFRYRQLQRIYFLLDDLKFHAYHKTNFTGIVKDITDFMTTLQRSFWSMINDETILGWFAQPWPLSTYASYTNSKFQDVERSDSFFLQNTKDYLILYIPIMTIIFIVCNRLFYRLFEYKVSILLRVFSFWFSLIMFLIIQNVTMLSFLACHHFTHMFSYEYLTRALQSITVVFIGLLLFLAFGFFFNCQYLYGRSSKHYLSNMSNKKQSFFLMFKYFIARPVLQTIVHAYCYQIPHVQLPLLSGIQLVGILILLNAEYRYSVFKIKFQLMCECTIDFSLALLNLILYLQYYVYVELSQLFQTCLIFIIYLNASIIILCIIHTSLYCSFKNQTKKLVRKKINKLLSKFDKMAALSPKKQDKLGLRNPTILKKQSEQQGKFDQAKLKQCDFI